jgi:hypothetical protein
MMAGGMLVGSLVGYGPERRYRAETTAQIAQYMAAEGHPRPWKAADGVYLATIAQDHPDALWNLAAACCTTPVVEEGGIPFVGPTTPSFRAAVQNGWNAMPLELRDFVGHKGVSIAAGRSLYEVDPDLEAEKGPFLAGDSHRFLSQTAGCFDSVHSSINLAEYVLSMEAEQDRRVGAAWYDEIAQGLWQRIDPLFVQGTVIHETVHALSYRINLGVCTPCLSDMISYQIAYKRDLDATRYLRQAKAELFDQAIYKRLEDPEGGCEEVLASVAEGTFLGSDQLETSQQDIREKLFPSCAALTDVFLYHLVKALREGRDVTADRKLHELFSCHCDIAQQACQLPRRADGVLAFD